MYSCSESTRPPVPPFRPPDYQPGDTCLEALPDYMKNCIHTYIYIFTADNLSYWMYPTEFIENILYGYIWNNPGWVYTKFELSQIESFY